MVRDNHVFRTDHTPVSGIIIVSGIGPAQGDCAGASLFQEATTHMVRLERSYLDVIRIGDERGIP
jgi:hypothetical protein